MDAPVHSLAGLAETTPAVLRTVGNGTPPPGSEHYRLAPERPFTAAERDRVTILIGGLPAKHERLIRAALHSCGYRCEALPPADLASCFVGKQYCNNGVCNPAYFTVGNLVRHLQALERQGVARQEILDRYVFLTAASCGPCRFGMYEAEYRLALRNAGFDGFRVLRFLQSQGMYADTGESGLRFTAHLGLGVFNALHFADVLNAFGYEVRPYEVTPGDTDAQLDRALEEVARIIRDRRDEDVAAAFPAWIADRLRAEGVAPKAARSLLRVRDHLSGPATREAIGACRDILGGIRVDRFRVKPIVKVTGEFWAQTTEGDGNFNMFALLEREGAHVLVEPIAGWVMYLLHQYKARGLARRGTTVPVDGGRWLQWRERLREERALTRRWALANLAKVIYSRQYDRIRSGLANVPRPLANQDEIADLARPFYNDLARGGEGHLEVGKTLYYTKHRQAHMVLSLKPFGCMPSTQSDGVQGAVAESAGDLLFVPIETAPDGELTAHSRVQMALVDARQKANDEFARALASTGRRLDDLREYVDRRQDFTRVFYRVPRAPGTAGTAASFVVHVAGCMTRERRARFMLAGLGAHGETAK